MFEKYTRPIPSLTGSLVCMSAFSVPCIALFTFLLPDKVHAQTAPVCTPNTSFSSATTTQISGTGTGGVLEVGDIYLFEDLLEDTNGDNVDLRFEVIALNDEAGTPSLGGTGSLAIDNVQLDEVLNNNDPFVAYKINFVVDGSLTSTNTDGIATAVTNLAVEISDLDSNSDIRNLADVGGFSNSSESIPDFVNLTATVVQDFIDSSLTGFTTYTMDPASVVGPIGDETDFFDEGNNSSDVNVVTLNWESFESAILLHGVTGFDDTSSNSRGAGLSLCATLVSPPVIEAGSEADIEALTSTVDVVVGSVLDDTNDTVDGDPADPGTDGNVVLTLESDTANASELTLDTTTGEITLAANTPAGTYTISYRITDPDEPTNFAVATETVVVETSPISSNDLVEDQSIETAVEVDVLDNDTAGVDASGAAAALDPETVSLVVPTDADPTDVTTVDGDVTQLVVPDEGTWPVDPTTGAITFDPEDGFIGDPTPVDYSVEDENGNVSNEATVTITYADPDPSIELVQTVTGIEDTNGDGVFGNAGDTILYEYTAENTGSTGLAGLEIDDNGLGDLDPEGVSFDDDGIADVTLGIGEGPVVVATAEYVIQPDDSGDLETQPTITSTAVAVDDTGAIVLDGGSTVTLFDESGDELAAVTDDSDTGSEPVIPQDGADGSTTVPTAVSTPATTDTDGTSGNDADEATVVTLPELTPEISVETSNGDVAIADGGTDTLTETSVGVEQTITYTVTNDGSGTLTLQEPTLDAGSTTNITDDDAGVTFGDLSATSLAPGETATFTVTFTPETSGAYDFDLTLPNDDAQDDVDESPYNITVAGSSDGAPEIDVTSSLSGAIPDDGEDDTGEALVGEEQAITYTVTNSGTDTLTLENPTISGETNLDGGVTVENPDDLTLEPGETTTFTVTFTPLDEGEFSFDIDLPNDDADENPYDIAVIGAAIAFNQEALERVLSEDLQNTTELISRSASDISRRAADRLAADQQVAHSCGQQVNDLLKDQPIQFANNKFFIDAANQRIIDQIAVILGQCQSANFIIAGHTDSDASDGYNLVLSQNRVDTVLDALVERGVQADRLRAQGFGESRPIATNATEEGQALNRRVEFILVDDDEAIAEGTGRCGEDDRNSRTLDGFADNFGANLVGNFASEGYNCVTGVYQMLWADLSVIHTDDASTTGRLSFGGSRDRQANGRLFGKFFEGYLSRTDISDADVTGEITGTGIHGGLYGANRTERGLLLSYYGSAAFGRHFFDVEAGTDADGHYTYGGLFVGGAVGGERAYQKLTVAPRIGLDLAYAAALGSEISISNVDLDIDPGRYGRLFVEADLIRNIQNGEMELTPRLFCAISGDEDADCGYGASLSYATLADDTLAFWDLTLDYDRIGDTQTTSLNMARTTPVFNDTGVSRSSIGANANGSIDAAQTIEFTW